MIELNCLALLPFPGPDAVEDTADQYSVRSKRMYLIDSGLTMFGSPYPMFLMTPRRAVDVFLSFETSDRVWDDNPPFQVLSCDLISRDASCFKF